MKRRDVAQANDAPPAARNWRSRLAIYFALSWGSEIATISKSPLDGFSREALRSLT
jgi:hypothetical protein